MKKLMKMFKSLPREVKMMLAMAGLASPIGAIYFLRRFFPGVSTFTLILCVAAVIVGICIIAFLISLVFKRGGKKRSSRMAQELASEGAAGPAGMDVSAAIKANNEKFFTAVRDLRKEVGISVYDLPWYIVVGDSGCGKTFLINNGGLTFSRGKPEGYQLGTLNYNWWFTEDAVFVDMAGRLCNPQDDADRREWEAFLNTIAKGRKGFPINGAILCVSAEHLLQDPPEKHEADANIALERLRDLQSKLGVTFATYLVVTKCDKILGFMQFFDRADRDITVKNQIFGWSRPGDFHELSDPERFKEDFAGVYHRLNDLRLRRLNDDADEIDLGLACSFPEEFRELLDPLHTYIRTLFPMIKSPRAVKNLLFRGIYLTSATQEGGLILKHLKERLGDEAADQFAPLDSLFPNKRPHFIKDVLFKKVFPEQGLVFRNEQQVLRNRKWSKVLSIATTVLAIGLFTAFGFSWHKFEQLIVEPRRHVKTVADRSEGMPATEALEQAAIIEADIANLEAHTFSARVLSMNFGHEKPVEHLKAVRVKLIERAMVAALQDVDDALQSGKATHLGVDRATAYLEALKQYVLWYGCAGQPQAPPELTSESFETLCGLAESGSIVADPEFPVQTGWYFQTLREDRNFEGRNPADLLGLAVAAPVDTILAALGHAYQHLLRLATLDDQHPDETIKEWMRIRGQCEQVRDSYQKMLDAADDAAEIGTQEDLQQFKEQFVSQFQRFDEALDGTAWGGKSVGSTLHDIRSLEQAVKRQRQFWLDYTGALTEAAGTCGMPDTRVKASIESIVAGSADLRRDGLDFALYRSLTDRGIVDRPYGDEFYERMFDKAVEEVYEIYPEILVFIKGDSYGTPPRLELTPTAERVRGLVGHISATLAQADFQVPEDLSEETVERWNEALDAHLERMGEAPEQITLDDVPESWQPDALAVLHDEYLNVIQLGEGTRLLKTVIARLDQAGPWGVAELIPFEERVAEKSSPYRIAAPERSTDRRERRVEPRKDEPKEPRKSRRPKRRPRRSQREVGEREERVAPVRDSGAGVRTAGGRVPALATHDFMNDRAAEMAELLSLLAEAGELDAFLRQRDGAEPLDRRCIQKLEDAARVYMEKYIRAWSTAYAAAQLPALERLDSRVADWNQLTSRMGSPSAGRGASQYDIANEFEDALAWLLREVSWVTYDPEYGWWHSDDYREWSELATWMDDAMHREWDGAELGDFVFARKDMPQGTDRDRLPWDIIAGQFRDAWMELSRNIVANGELPRQFQEVDAWTSTAIPWGSLAELRDTFGLDDEERLIGALVRFEERAQQLLSAELTQVFCNIQRTYLKRAETFGGWPYLPGEQYSPTGLDTVEFQKFKRFLVEVHRAGSAFKGLEDDLPENAVGRSARKAFCRGCDEWFRFLDLGNDFKSDAKALQIRVKGADATEAPFGQERVDDTAQFNADYFVLDLHLTLSREDRAGRDETLRIATKTEYKVKEREVSWEWPGAGGELAVRLEGNLRNIKDPARILGRSSPLALCAYLHRYGENYNNDPKTWYVSHAFERSEATGGPGETTPGRKMVGEKAIFMLARPLPDPIPSLEEVNAPPPSSG